ncbi:MAG: HipA N-terminal domain-containing protein [Saprospiraceae bacterium]|nr:HipA N-terminal domain-containing protein [Lewinellaceae bacterium]
MKSLEWLSRHLRSDEASTQGTKKLTKSVSRIVFRLMYKNDEIGTLEFSSNKWVFAYSDWFKNQSNIKPFSNFPDVNREYVSDDLPPFFESRLPGISQPQVEAFLALLEAKESINEAETKVALLKQFGRHTITNPFELQPAF